MGHAKGAIHYAYGDKDAGDEAMKAASRTIGVIGGGIGGMCLAGPVGAVAGGIAGGAALDGITTAVDSAVHKEYRPAGLVKDFENLKIADDNQSIDGEGNGVSNHKTGEVFDIGFNIAMDGALGYGAG